MDDESDLIFVGAGSLGAVLLGLALFPIRELTNASNFTFAFLALVIVTAEYGGRRAAVATALTSTLSLDFFLTQPYLRLAIDSKHDVIAFFGLAFVGLIAAAFGSQRGRHVVELTRAQTHLAVLRSVLRRLEEAGPPERTLTELVATLRIVFPLAGVVIRDQRGRVLAAAGPATPTEPTHVLKADLLLRATESADPIKRGELPLPSDGGRLDLYFVNQRTGTLELWGNGSPASSEDRRALQDVARAVAAILGSGRLDRLGDKPESSSAAPA